MFSTDKIATNGVPIVSVPAGLASEVCTVLPSSGCFTARLNGVAAYRRARIFSKTKVSVNILRSCSPLLCSLLSGQKLGCYQNVAVQVHLGPPTATT
mmetsp:Transcript_34204/g.90368  ORF Transcript_34204/g.90368 Transcript_34204/m.90368 type:complete len:97 (+) Transcript_34204:335-625(+)